MGDFKYKGGVLIIGSLLWDPDRAEWRQESFGNDFHAIIVRSPIRYGRYSSGEKRQCPTMVFNYDFEKTGRKGKTKVISFQNAEMTMQEVINAARGLSFAEGSRDDDFIKGDPKWCILLFQLNPKLNQEKKLYFMQHWVKNYNYAITGKIQDYFRMESEVKAVFDINGELQIEWPIEINHLDFILATQTQPRKTKGDRSDFLNPAEIASQFHARPEYFFKNRLNGIQTSQDDQIISFLRAFDRSTFINNCLAQGLMAEEISLVFPDLNA